jgi:predicted transcriptional regulator
MKLIIDDSELKNLSKPSIPLPEIDGSTGEIRIPEILGRPKGGKNLSDLTKELIAYESVNSPLTQKQIAAIHGVTEATVNHLSQGYNTTNIDTRKENEDIKAVLNERKYNIADKATAKLMQSLDLFEPTSLEQLDLPGAALKMASVVQKISENFAEHNNNNIQFIVYAPRMRSESSYETIEVNE